MGSFIFLFNFDLFPFCRRSVCVFPSPPPLSFASLFFFGSPRLGAPAPTCVLPFWESLLLSRSRQQVRAGLGPSQRCFMGGFGAATRAELGLGAVLILIFLIHSPPIFFFLAFSFSRARASGAQAFAEVIPAWYGRCSPRGFGDWAGLFFSFLFVCARSRQRTAGQLGALGRRFGGVFARVLRLGALFYFIFEVRSWEGADICARSR
ncbi:hypothetical protein B0H13DRAFT_976647 [Mycena leptocephala]|nr:hypothetical protein B0H13DRAFT_976647 [Mycena leptocephala]